MNEQRTKCKPLIDLFFRFNISEWIRTLTFSFLLKPKLIFHQKFVLESYLQRTSINICDHNVYVCRHMRKEMKIKAFLCSRAISSKHKGNEQEMTNYNHYSITHFEGDSPKMQHYWKLKCSLLVWAPCEISRCARKLATKIKQSSSLEFDFKWFVFLLDHRRIAGRNIFDSLH